MRHRKSGKRLGRNTSHRKAMMRNMVTSLFEHEKITTTDARAKELRKIAEKLITLAKRGDLHARRIVLQVVRDKQTVAKLFEKIAPRYQERPGGYTRIVKLGHRAGDNAALSLIELVEEEFKPKPKKKTPKTKAETTPPTKSTKENVKEPVIDTLEDSTAKNASEEPNESSDETDVEKLTGTSEESVEEDLKGEVTEEVQENPVNEEENKN